MNSPWQEFLEKHNAVVDQDRITSFGPSGQPYPGTQDTCVCELTQLGLIRVTGEEAHTFLHSQFTNDLTQVTDHTSQLSSYCNPKGRVLSIFRIFKRDGDYYLVLPKDVIDLTLKKLTMFKLRAQVELQDASEQLTLFGVAGPEVQPALESINVVLPQTENDCIQVDGTVMIRLPSENVRVLFVADAKAATTICDQLCEQLPLVTSGLWDLHDISCGVPQVTAHTSETFTPQMINLELIDGVSFSKGCYPGQEVVARTHYLGKPNRRMYRASIMTKQAIQSGTNIFSAEDDAQALGKVVVSQMVSAKQANALVVLRTQIMDESNLHIASTDGPGVSLKTLPYSLGPGAT